MRKLLLSRVSAWSIYPWLVWFVGAAFFMVEYVARISPSVMRKSLLHDFSITSGQFGSLSAIFQLIYIAMQLPVGILTDRFGPGRLLACSIFVCALSCYGFSISESLFEAQSARFFMGLSGSFAFVCTLKLATVWFSQSHLGLLAGMTQIMGMAGGASGSMVLPYWIQAYGWRFVMLVIAAVLAIIFLVCCLLISDNLRKKDLVIEKSPIHHWYDGLRYILTDSQTWINASIAGLIYLPTAVIGELWGPMYFEQIYGIGEIQAAKVTGWIFVGWGIGGALNGWYSDYLLLRRPTLIYSAAICVCLLVLILFFPVHTFYSLSLICFVYGFCNTGVVTAYAVATELNPKNYTGTSIAFTNMISILYGVIYLAMLGYILDYSWGGVMVDGERIYSTTALYSVMTLLPLALLLALYLSVYCLRETYCQNYEKRAEVSSDVC